MYYLYQYVKNNKFRSLNFHFAYFIRKAINASKDDEFIPANYFYKTFLNEDGEIAPNKKFNQKFHVAFENFFNVFKKLSMVKKKEFYDLVILTQSINKCFENTSILTVQNLQIAYLNNLLGNNKVLKELMDVLWLNLSSSNVWDISTHYSDFYDFLPSTKVCPFCGLMKITDKDLGREDYDHIAYKGNYPLSAILDINFAPTCCKCNRNYKKQQDVFYKEGVRRFYKYPFVLKGGYSMQTLEINLNGSTHPGIEETCIEGNWIINICPDNQSTKTWEEIYSIKTRYSSWVKIEWTRWAKELVFAASIDNNNTDEEKFISYMQKYKTTYSNFDLEYPLRIAYYNFIENCMSKKLFNYINSLLIA
ncbi:hypothetical protein EGI15_13360 [Chryseobacterium cucumeris]|uniref:HNH endonuclease n=1 Tax=Chryseobacterium cucumeris TaxID=1813611 RepID=A0ABX9X5G4_9FLAO|nr:hypothetical protein [Chryseobacterium cucumeris]ROH91521.1 hypothetical protein EGI15_13360 [Chryseobacterium cucumeris]